MRRGQNLIFVLLQFLSLSSFTLSSGFFHQAWPWHGNSPLIHIEHHEQKEGRVSFSQLNNFGGTVLSCLVCDTRPRLEPTHPGNPPTTRVFQRGHLQVSADRPVTQSLYIARSLTVSFPWAFLHALEEELCFLIWSREETPQLSSPVNYSFFPLSLIVTPEPFLILALMSKFFYSIFFFQFTFLCAEQSTLEIVNLLEGMS